MALQDSDAPSLWSGQVQQIQLAMYKYWRDSGRFRGYARLQTPEIWLDLRHKLNTLLSQPGVKQLTAFELFLLHTATNLYELGWPPTGLLQCSYSAEYARSGQMIRESVNGNHQLGLVGLDRQTIEMLAQLCTAIGWTELTPLSIEPEQAGYREEVRLRYLATLLQIADLLLIHRANNIYLRALPALAPCQLADARIALQPYISAIKLQQNKLTLALWVHPDDEQFANKMVDLFLEPIRHWLARNREWLAANFQFVLTINEPIKNIAHQGLPPEPLALTCPALIPFLHLFQPANLLVNDLVVEAAPAKSPLPSLSDKPIHEPVKQPSLLSIPAREQERSSAFICYSPRDEKYLERLQVHLAYYERLKLVDSWDATKIAPGSLKSREIEKAIARAKVAIVLISADFLASRFIADNELAPLLLAAQSEYATILPIILSPSAFETSSLAQFESVNQMDRPVTRMSRNEREELWSKVAKIVYQVTSTAQDEQVHQRDDGTAAVQTNDKVEVHAPPIVAPENQGQTAFTVQKGQLLWDQYRVTYLAGRTAHSQVAKAWDEALQRDVAIKLFYLDQERDQGIAEQLRKNLLREARILGKLEHRNIGRVYNAIVTPPPAIVMQWVEGKSLEELFAEDEYMPLSEVVRLGIELAAALQYIHEHGIVHRDIKPSNIILNAKGVPLIIDFDIARSKQLETITRRDDGSFAYVGNPPYSAPEQFVSPELLGPPADIFSLGVVLYEALMHQMPYSFGNNPKNYGGRLPRPEQDTIPEQLYLLLCTLLEQEPEKRPQASLVQAQLQAFTL